VSLPLAIALAVLGGGLFGAFVVWRLKSRHPFAVVTANARTVEDELRAQVERRESELLAIRADLATTNQRNGELSERLKVANETLATERDRIQNLEEEFQKEFKRISNQQMLDNRSEFSKQSAENLETLLKPFREELKDFKAKLENTQLETANYSVLLKNEVSRIGTDATNLAKALKGDVRVLGTWGENMLDRILEKSGLQEGLHFRRQQSSVGEGGDRRRLDVIVDLPDNKHLVIDSKVSLNCYEQQANSTDDLLRTKHLKAHLDCLRTHVRNLSAKRYHELYGINSPEFVLMYVPIEAAFFVAVSEDPSLFSDALDKNVVLTTNSTLLATLRTAASVWRVADQQRHAIEIARRGGQLYDKFIGFINDLQDVGKALQKSREAWDAASNKLHTGTGNLVRQVELLRELGVKASRALPAEIRAKMEQHADTPKVTIEIATQHELLSDANDLIEETSGGAEK
jgi:DNA recombination protein RmuC